jgi:hypothetical protein
MKRLYSVTIQQASGDTTRWHSVHEVEAVSRIEAAQEALTRAYDMSHWLYNLSIRAVEEVDLWQCHN